jgi:hypothetical protein
MPRAAELSDHSVIRPEQHRATAARLRVNVGAIDSSQPLEGPSDGGTLRLPVSRYKDETGNGVVGADAVTGGASGGVGGGDVELVPGERPTPTSSLPPVGGCAGPNTRRGRSGPC